MAKYFWRSGLTGGTGNDLDGIPSASLTTGDVANVIDGTNFYVYHYDSTDATAESSPDTIEPDDGGGAWSLQASKLVTDWTDLANVPAGFADGIDNTGLPAEIKLSADYADLATAISTIGATPVTLYINDNYNVNETLTFPSTMSVQFIPGYALTRTGASANVTFNGQLVADPNATIFNSFLEDEITISNTTRDIFVQWFGLANDGVTNDYQPIATMAAALSDGQHVYFPAGGNIAFTASGGNSTDGSYTFGARVSISASNISVHGRNSTITVGDSSFLFIHGPVQETDTGLSIAMTKGEAYFTIPAAITTLTVGDMIELYDNTAWLTSGVISYKRGILAVVTDIVGSVAYIDTAPKFSFTGTNATVFAASKNNLVEGFNIDMSSNASTNNNIGIALNHTSNSTVRNVTAIGSDYAAAAIWMDGVNNKAENLTIDTFLNKSGLDTPAGGRWGYAVAANGNNSSVSRLTSKNCKHHITSGSSVYNSFNITATDSYLWNDPDLETDQTAVGSTYLVNAPLDFHANNIDGTFERITIDSPTDSLILVRNPNMRIVNNTFYQRGAGQGDADPIINTGEAGPEFIEFSGNIVISEPGDDLTDNDGWNAMGGRGNTFVNVTQGADTLESGEVGYRKFDFNNAVDISTFEAGLDGWTFNTGGETTSDSRNNRTTTSPRTGSYSVGVFGSNTSAVTFAGANIQQTFTLPHGTYKLSFWLKTSGADSEQALSASTDNDGSLSITGPVPAAPNWQYFEDTITSDGTVAVTIGNGTAGYYDTYQEGFWIDDIKITKVPQAANLLIYDSSTGSYGPLYGITGDGTNGGISIESIGSTASTRGLAIYQHSNSAAGGNIAAFKSESSDNSPGAGDAISAVRNLNTYLGYGWDGNSYELAAGLYLQSEGAFSEGSPNGAFKVFLSDGSTYAQRFGVNSDSSMTLGAGSEPTANAANRGKIIRTEGGAGVADTLRVCMKSAGDTYSWVTIATG